MPFYEASAIISSSSTTPSFAHEQFQNRHRISSVIFVVDRSTSVAWFPQYVVAKFDHAAAQACFNDVSNALFNHLISKTVRYCQTPADRRGTMLTKEGTTTTTTTSRHCCRRVFLFYDDFYCCSIFKILVVVVVVVVAFSTMQTCRSTSYRHGRPVVVASATEDDNVRILSL